jgi:hypothetical protein
MFNLVCLFKNANKPAITGNEKMKNERIIMNLIK